jgi:hypothetical protein
MNQIKNSFLRKKAGHSSNRSVGIKAPNDIKSVLLISNKEKKTIKEKIEKLFPNASVYHVHLRDIKEDRTIGFYYSVHKSDFNLTGKLKNDKLMNLEKMEIDLLVDLSTESELLEYFVSKNNAHLKVGNIRSNKSNFYDFLIEFGSSDEESINNIHIQLNTLTQNASEQT